jgi:hypothetical protein
MSLGGLGSKFWTFLGGMSDSATEKAEVVGEAALVFLKCQLPILAQLQDLRLFLLRTGGARVCVP